MTRSRSAPISAGALLKPRAQRVSYIVELLWRPMADQDGQNARLHYRAKARRVAWVRGMVAENLMLAHIPRNVGIVVLGGTVRIRVEQRRGPLPDGDNQRGMLKSCRDGIAAWLGVDDADGKPLVWEYVWERGAADRTVIEIELEVGG